MGGARGAPRSVPDIARRIRKPAGTPPRRIDAPRAAARSRNKAPVIVALYRMSGNRDLPLPSYATDGSAGVDLAACLDRPVVIEPGSRTAVGTGLRIALPPGYEAEIRPRSGLAAKHGLTLVNAPGTIDADYRGEIRILLINLGTEPVTIRRGDRIAQMLVRPVSRAAFVEVGELPPTARGEGGFGHTGE